MEIKERKVNEVFRDFNGNKVKAVWSAPVGNLGTCRGCCYVNNACYEHKDIIGPCASTDRSDDKDVIFKDENDNEK